MHCPVLYFEFANGLRSWQSRFILITWAYYVALCIPKEQCPIVMNSSASFFSLNCEDENTGKDVIKFILSKKTTLFDSSSWFLLSIAVPLRTMREKYIPLLNNEGRGLLSEGPLKFKKAKGGLEIPFEDWFRPEFSENIAWSALYTRICSCRTVHLSGLHNSALL